MADALAKSQAWNTANPGKQRCFQWGPLTSPNGGTESGGVCANPIGVSSGASETLTRTEQVTRVSSISNTNRRTAAAVELLKSLDPEERSQLLEVTQTSNRRAVLDIDLTVPKIRFIVTATSDDLPKMTFRGTTNSDGESRIRTRKNLEGYALTLSVRKVKLDLDVLG
jgi:galactokinase